MRFNTSVDRPKHYPSGRGGHQNMQQLPDTSLLPRLWSTGATVLQACEGTLFRSG